MLGDDKHWRFLVMTIITLGALPFLGTLGFAITKQFDHDSLLLGSKAPTL
jgi:hypothetical protein